MSVLKSLRVLARYNVLTPIAILAAVATPGVAMAVDNVVPAGATVSQVTLNTGDTLTNGGTIADTVGVLVTPNENATFILNNSAISATDDGIVIGFGGSVGSIVNRGTIVGTTGRGIAGYTGGRFLSLINSGSITGALQGVLSNGAVVSLVNEAGGMISATAGDGVLVLSMETFTNAGSITGTEDGVDVDNAVGSFSNTNTITGGNRGVHIGGATTTFSNAGSITGTNDYSVQFDSTVGTFTNLAGGTIAGNGGVQVNGAVTALFSNAGTITSTSQNGIEFGGPVAAFTNLASGKIAGQTNGVTFSSTAATFNNAGEITGTLGTGAQFNGLVGTFTNSGSIKHTMGGDDAVSFFGGVTNFTNDTGGLIQNTLAGTSGGGKAIGVNIDGIVVSSFINRGSILGGTADTLNHQDATVNFYSNNATATQVVSFWNFGTISGIGTGVNSDGDQTHGGFATFVNALGGTITSTANNAVSSRGPIGSFTNAGTLNGAGYNALNFNGGVMSFVNDTTGVIRNTDALYFGPNPNPGFGGGAINFNTDTGNGGAVGSFINRGQIFAASNTDIHDGSNTVNFGSNGTAFGLTSFLNTGLISGPRTAVGFDGVVTSFSNSGTLTGAGYQTLNFNAGVTNFLNDVGGLIQNTDATHVDNLANSRGTAISIYADSNPLSTFVNRGTILGAPDATRSTVDVYSPSPYTISLFLNEGKISHTGTLAGVAIQGLGTVSNFVNAGEIVATSASIGGAFNGVYINHNADIVTNSGLISGASGGLTVIGLGTLNNTASGRIIGTGAGYGSPIAAHGVIAGINRFATINNAGYIEGADLGAAIYLAGGGTVTNSGTLKGGSGGAIWFDDFNSVTDDKVTILTGSKIFGELNFTGGNDTLDFAGFMGNTVLDVKSLNTIVAGNRAYFDLRDVNGDGKVAIIDVSGLGNSVIGQNDLDLGLAMLEMIHANAQDNDAGQPAEPLQFAPTPAKTSALAAVDTAVLTELDTVQHMGVTVWGGFIGGGSNRTLPIDQASLYGGLVMGTHARLNETFKLGGTAGYVVTNTSTQAGQQTLASQTGVVGVYSNISLGGVADIDLALLGGLSSHTSKRQVIANNQVQTATGLFTSYFFAPSAALSVPVLSGDAGTILFKTSATYVGGLTSAYTETGSAMNLAVGSQTISVFDARAGLEGRHGFDLDSGTTAELVAKAGVFAQINNGSASVPVTTLGQTINVATPGSSAYGVYGGVGVDAQLTESLKLTISTDGSFRTDGLNTVSIKGGLAGTF